jgi:hypothetical protein
LYQAPDSSQDSEAAKNEKSEVNEKAEDKSTSEENKEKPQEPEAEAKVINVQVYCLTVAPNSCLAIFL